MVGGGAATAIDAMDRPAVLDRTALIDRYAAGPADVVDALAGITAEELDRAPAPDAWTAREIVHHLADSETNSYVRLRRMLRGRPRRHPAVRRGRPGPPSPGSATTGRSSCRSPCCGRCGPSSTAVLRRLDDGRLRPPGRPPRARALLGPGLARDLRRPRSRPRRPDPAGAAGRGLVVVDHLGRDRPAAGATPRRSPPRRPGEGDRDGGCRMVDQLAEATGPAHGHRDGQGQQPSTSEATSRRCAVMVPAPSSARLVAKRRRHLRSLAAHAGSSRAGRAAVPGGAPGTRTMPPVGRRTGRPGRSGPSDSTIVPSPRCVVPSS